MAIPAQFEGWDRLPMLLMPTLLSMTEILLSTPLMPTIIQDSQSMAPMTTNLINLTNNAEELGNSLTV
jgi:hypothetical protein